MPLIVVRLTEGSLTPAQKLEMAERLTQTMAAIQGDHTRSFTRVIIEELGSGNWNLGGRPLATGARTP